MVACALAIVSVSLFSDVWSVPFQCAHELIVPSSSASLTCLRPSWLSNPSLSLQLEGTPSSVGHVHSGASIDWPHVSNFISHFSVYHTEMRVHYTHTDTHTHSQSYTYTCAHVLRHTYTTGIRLLLYHCSSHHTLCTYQASPEGPLSPISTGSATEVQVRCYLPHEAHTDSLLRLCSPFPELQGRVEEGGGSLRVLTGYLLDYKNVSSK